MRAKSKENAAPEVEDIADIVVSVVVFAGCRCYVMHRVRQTVKLVRTVKQPATSLCRLFRARTRVSNSLCVEDSLRPESRSNSMVTI